MAPPPLHAAPAVSDGLTSITDLQCLRCNFSDLPSERLTALTSLTYLGGDTVPSESNPALSLLTPLVTDKCYSGNNNWLLNSFSALERLHCRDWGADHIEMPWDWRHLSNLESLTSLHSECRGCRRPAFPGLPRITSACAALFLSGSRPRRRHWAAHFQFGGQHSLRGFTFFPEATHP